MINPHQFRAPEKPRWPAGPFSAPMGENIYEAPKAPSQFWLNAGARNIELTSRSHERRDWLPSRRVGIDWTISLAGWGMSLLLIALIIIYMFDLDGLLLR